ncbi:FtsX-like permease family protein [Streptomyces sp. NPDC056069]|uniref:FtsX-like permease family protein n=1 Tax=Streptomyces sp. NPDC056069 TaxID=3345702 RepID=UPI0035E3B54B
MLTVVLAGLRARWASFVGGFTALTLGVGLVAVMGLGLSATLRAPERAPERFASSPVVVQGRDRIAVEVRRGPGTAVVTTPLDRPQPVDRELLRELRARWTVTTSATDTTTPAAPAPAPAPPSATPAAPAATAAGIPLAAAPPGGPDAVGVDAPAAEVRALVGDRARVLTGAERRAVDPEAARDAQALVTLNALLGTAGGVTTFVSVFVVASTFAFAVALRRREYGLLRMAGATPGQVRRMLLAEATGVGIAASAAGCLLGAWGASRLARVLVDGGAAPSWFAIDPGAAAWPYHLAFWTGTTVALAGALAASRRAGRVGPTAALREADVDADVLPRGRALLGAALLLTGVGLMVWTCATEPSELLKRKTYTTQPMLLITGVALLSPLLVRPAARAVRLWGAAGMLVRENSAAAVRRTAAVAAPVLVTVALAGTLLGSAATVTGAKAAEARRQTTAAYVTTPGKTIPLPASTPVPPAPPSVPPAPPSVPPAPSAVPRASVAATGATSVFVREGAEALVKYGARAVADPTAWASYARLPVVAGDLRKLDDGSIVVNEEFERRTVGETVEVWRADGRGPVRLRVVAVLAKGTGDNGPYVTWANAPGATVDRIDADRPVRVPGGTVRTAGAWAAATHPTTTPQTRLGLLLVLGIALVYTVIALANTLLMATSVRGPELTALRLAGATRAQVLRVVAGESLLATAIGAVLGLAVTALCLGTLGTGLAALSAPVAMAVPWGALGLAAGICAAVATAAATVPAWRLSR